MKLIEKMNSDKVELLNVYTYIQYATLFLLIIIILHFKL